MDLFWLWGQPGLQMEFQVSQGSTVRFPSLKWANISEGGARRWFSWQRARCTSVKTWAWWWCALEIPQLGVQGWQVPAAHSQRIDELQPLWEALSQKQRWGVIDEGTCSWSLASTCMWTLEHEHLWSYVNTPTRISVNVNIAHTYTKTGVFNSKH